MQRIYADWNELEGEIGNRRVSLNTFGSRQSIEEIGGIGEGMRLLADDGDVQTEIIVEQENGRWYGRIMTDFSDSDQNKLENL